MNDGYLKSKLMACAEQTQVYEKKDYSIGHRGAALMFPEHTIESYMAAIVQGAGIVECDVTFTKDRQLVCRHSQCDLHTTTNVVTIPELNAKCSTPFVPGGEPLCCTSDFTLAEIKMMCAKMDASVGGAMTPEEYIGGTSNYRTDLYSVNCPKVPSHAESIELMMKYGVKYTPELKTPSVEMPYEGDYTQEDYAQQMIDEYLMYGVHPDIVWPQSFLWTDVAYWMKNTDYYQAVALEETYDAYDFSKDEFGDHVSILLNAGVSILAPPLYMLLDTVNNQMVASDYAKYALEYGFDIIGWTLERSSSLALPGGGGFYYESVADVVENDGDMFNYLYALDTEVGVLGIFSDWPATVTFYANCMHHD
ncbi:hypothetical protein ACA910_003313 [Epithemia clementina (nom. ined.)]